MIAIANHKSQKHTDTLFAQITKPDFSINAFHEDKQLYYAFISILGRYVVKDTIYRGNQPTAPNNVDNWFNVKDEAIALVLFENGIDRWNAEIKYKKAQRDLFWLVELDKEAERTLPPYKYTQRNKKAGSVMNDGWGYEGISRYITILQKVESFRKTPLFLTFSENIITSMRSGTQNRGNLKRKRQQDALKEVEEAKKLAGLFNSQAMHAKFHIPVDANTMPLQEVFSPKGFLGMIDDDTESSETEEHSYSKLAL